MNGCHASRLRCVVCGNPNWHPSGTAEECTHCGLTVASPMALARAATEITARLATGEAAGTGNGWSLAPHAWRNAAWRFGFVIDQGVARRAVPAGRPDVTLGVMCRPLDLPAVSALIDDIGDRFGRTIVILDAAEPIPIPRATVLAAPLAGGFAAQRNRLQAAATTRWVLQLDSDERPTPELLDALAWLPAAADRGGLRSLGLPRANLVDGRRSALWPDIQYRLNHADVRYAGSVHERPELPFEQTSLALAGAIEHCLDSDRVRARTRLYGAMADGAARPQDEARLLRPYDAIADR